MRKTAMTIVICLAAITAAIWGLQTMSSHGTSVEAPPQFPPSPEEFRVQPTLVPASPLPNPPSESGPVKESSQAPKLAHDFAESRDWRVFFENALRRGAEGGGFYALRILVNCSAMREQAASFVLQAAKSESQETARRLYIERCASFSPDEISAERTIRLTTDQRIKNDPLRAIFNEANRVSQRDLAADILATSDPLLLEGLAGSLFSRAGTTGLNFGGQSYQQPEARDVFNAAWLAAICEGTGLNCSGPLDPYVMDFCATRNVCATSREEAFAVLLRAEHGNSAEALYKELRPRLAAIIRERDVASLVQ